ncbi:MAG TPA: DUF2911 domain-containing protein [Rubricoccaceae bacterium]|jgi:hypothetical protein
MRFLFLCLVLAAVAAPTVRAQTRASDEVRPSPNALVGQTIGTTDVTITYGRPSVRGRDVFGPDTTSLVPFGQVWRLGANEATTLTVSAPVRVAGQPLAAGTYAVFAIPGAAEWTLVLNRVAEQWGAFRYDATQDALRVTATPQAFPHAVEMFEIGFDDVSESSATLTFTWDRVRVPVRIEAGA